MHQRAIRPDLPGPILLAGSPLSYWAGVRGKAPLRYLGGLLGGTWLTSLAGDLGDGIFDGASLVANFGSWGDDITPPPQALDWILDLYNREDEITANGQTIVYALHQSIGHLGIFVS